MMQSLGWETGTDEMKQAVKYLKETGSPKVGVTGEVVVRVEGCG